MLNDGRKRCDSLFWLLNTKHEDIYKSCYINTKREAFPSWESANN